MRDMINREIFYQPAFILNDTVSLSASDCMFHPYSANGGDLYGVCHSNHMQTDIVMCRFKIGKQLLKGYYVLLIIARKRVLQI
jgi:hypothetical protein